MTEPGLLLPTTALRVQEMEEATSHYEASLTVEAARWLLNRGITEEAANTFRLGVVGSDPASDHWRYRGWLAIPYIVGEQVVQVRFRCIEDHDHSGHGKYGQSAGERSRPFNVNALQGTSNEIHLTEGEFDAIILSMLGLPAMAFPGAKTFQSFHTRLLAGFQTVWLWGDPDEAGRNFNAEVTRAMPHSAKSVKLTDGDVTETFQTCGADYLYDLVGK